MESQDLYFLKEAIDLGYKGVSNNEGGPFGCVIVKDGIIIGRGNNKVLSLNDPTAHAEVVAIRDACKQLGGYQLTGCTVFTSCEPCPMCLGAIYWARPDRVVYACTREDAADSGFDDDFIYKEILLPPSARQIPMEQGGRDLALPLFDHWNNKENKRTY
jgi:tRNA(Arg) A34 adenosine deaminase TadA